MASKEEDIRKLLTLMGVDHEAVSKKVKERVSAVTSSAIPSEKKAGAEKVIDKLFADDPVGVQLTSAHVKAYGSRFSHDEILSLIDFYGGPVGKKFVDSIPGISEEILKTNKRIMSSIVDDVYKALREAGLLPKDEKAEAAKSGIMSDIMKRLSN